MERELILEAPAADLLTTKLIFGETWAIAYDIYRSMRDALPGHQPITLTIWK